MIVVIAVMTTEKGRSSRFRSIRVIFFLFLFVFVFATGVANAHLVKYASSDSSIDKASDFNLKTLDGKQITIASFKGKPTVIWFMAAWCPSCIGQTDAIKKVKSEFGDNINILVIDMWSLQTIGGQSSEGLNAETEVDLKNFLGKYGSPQWEAAVDTD